MIITCPHCQARLNLPEHVAGEQVRCSICRQVFQAGSPDSASASATPQPREEEKRPRANKRRFEDDDDELRELIANAKSLARPAAYAMLAAFLITTINGICNMAMTIAKELEDPAQQDVLPEFFSCLVCSWIFLYGPMLAFIAIAARSLFRLGSRSLILAGIVMNIVALLLLGGAAVLCFLCVPDMDYVLWTGIAMNGVSCLVNPTAAILAIRVLTFHEVADAYAARAEVQLQRRF